MRALTILALLAGSAEAELGIAKGGESGHRLHIDLDAAFTYAYAPPADGFGVLVRSSLRVPVRNLRRATGTLDIGLELGYQNQPYSLFSKYLGVAESLTGADHRVNLWLSLGHTFHMLQNRRLTLGVRAFAGLTHFASVGNFANTREMVAGSFSTANDVLAFGLGMSLGYRFVQGVGIRVGIDGFPLGGEWGSTGYCTVALGLFTPLR